MIRRLYYTENGQAAAEFCIALLVLVPLIFWMLRLGDLLNAKHKTIETVRLASWEKAYGRKETEIADLMSTIIEEGALFSNPASYQINTSFSTESSKSDLNWLSYVCGWPDWLELSYDNYYQSQITIQGKLPFGLDFTLNENYALLGDPWNLSDQNNDGQIQNEDLETSVNRMYLWMPVVDPNGLEAVNRIINIAEDVINSSPVRVLAWIFGSDLDVRPKGHPNLREIPETQD